MYVTRRALLATVLALVVLTAGCAGVAVETGGEPGGAATATAPPGSGGTPATATPPSDGLVVTVTRVIDGDTVEVRYENGSTDTARLLGVDTPEVHTANDPAEFEGVPESEAGRSCLREYGERASAYVTRRLVGETVTLAFDANEPRRGYYDRLLVYIHHDGGSLNYALVDRGLARVYDSSFERGDRFYAAEERAMAAGRGVWSCRDGTPAPKTVTDGGTTTGTATPTGDGVVVSEIHADAEGSDAENLNDEYVVLTNRGESAVNLTGWTLTDAAGHEYGFPAFTLPAGESVTVHVGAGEDTDTDRYWGRERPTLNNDGETVILRDANGTVVDERSG